MCGIAGIVDLAGQSTPRETVIVQMTEAQRHRGPDGAGVVLLPGLGFGHRRLAVIDLAGGAQPMADASGNVLITFNGEIYNFADLRGELEALGHRFRTRSDTEVLLEGWRAWGTGVLHRLNGMFAFALWDEAAETLFLARDRLGEKPLYYGHDSQSRMVFASELQGILPALDGTPPLDPEGLADYLAFGYVPDPRSIWRGVRKLPPAHYLLVRRRGSPAEPVRYWRPDFTPRHAGSQDDLAVELLDRLATAVQRRLIADVPLGAFLSGGVDSGGVVALMARAGVRPVVTCSLGFREPEFDESSAAADLARRLGTDHHTETVGPDACAMLDQLAAAMGEPFADASALPNYLVATLARSCVTVALSGDGGDELFAGYRRYGFHRREEQVKALLPEALRAVLFGTAARWYPKLDWAPRSLRAKATLEAMATGSAQGYLRSVTVLPPGDRTRLLAARLVLDLGGYDPASTIARHLADAGTDDPVARAQYVDLMTWLPGRMLVKVDRTSMAHGLEVRPPMLDHELVEWAAGLPTAVKIADGSGKAVLKRAIGPLLGSAAIALPKRGFSLPLAAWLKKGMRGRLDQVQGDGRLYAADIVEPSALESLVAEHGSGRRDHSQILWTLLMLDAFLARHHIAPSRPALAA
jgi:asparagine synthase (glutamine-hydrolysing)